MGTLRIVAVTTTMPMLLIGACGLNVVGTASDAPPTNTNDAAGTNDRAGPAPTDGSQVGDNGIGDSSNDGGPTGDGAGSQPDALAELGCNASASSNLLAYWRLDDGNGTTATDCTSGAHHGTLIGPSTWPSPGRIGPYALSFTGAGSVTFGQTPSFDLTGAMSITAWVNVTSFSTDGRILSKSSIGGDRGWELSVEAIGSAGFKIAVDPNTRIEVYAPSIPQNQWIHLAGVYEPNVAVRLYVNGTLTAVATGAIPATQHNTNHAVTLGDRPVACCPWQGLIDDVRLFGRALPASDVALLAAQ